MHSALSLNIKLQFANSLKSKANTWLCFLKNKLPITGQVGCNV